MKRNRMDLAALLLHLYLYFLFLVNYVLTDLFLIWVPPAAVGGYYFTHDLRRRFKPLQNETKP